MRILSSSAIAIVAVAGCLSDPDVRRRDPTTILRDGHGGWIVIIHRNSSSVAGELIAVEPRGLRVLEGGDALVYEPFEDVRSAELFEYETREGTLGIWGTLGSVSTISHGFLAAFSLPIWITTTITAVAIESRTAHLEYPGDPWNEFGSWARFPQGLPPGLLATDLIRQDRRPKLPPPPPAPPEPVAPPTDPVAPPVEPPP